MRKSFYFPIENKKFESEILHRTVPGAPGRDIYGTARLLCEFLNDGHHVYMRKFVSGSPTSTFVWSPYRMTRPLLCHASSKAEGVVNLLPYEMAAICLLGHTRNTAHLAFGYRFHSQKVLQEQFFVPEWSTIGIQIYPEKLGLKEKGLLVVWKGRYC